MTDPVQSLASTLHEYTTTLDPEIRQDPTRLQQALVHQLEWTPHAAETLTHLAHDYGVFMLRHALALAVAIDKEDGDLGF